MVPKRSSRASNMESTCALLETSAASGSAPSIVARSFAGAVFLQIVDRNARAFDAEALRDGEADAVPRACHQHNFAVEAARCLHAVRLTHASKR